MSEPPVTRRARLLAWANHVAKALMPWVAAGYVETSARIETQRGAIGWREINLVATSSLFTYLKSNGRKPKPKPKPKPTPSPEVSPSPPTPHTGPTLPESPRPGTSPSTAPPPS